MNGIFQFMTLEEAIELMLDMNAKNPRLESKEFPTGLYIETKMYEFYQRNYNLSIAAKTFEVLQRYNLSTIE